MLRRLRTDDDNITTQYLWLEVEVPSDLKIVGSNLCLVLGS